ncbi:DNA polymerase III subunit psi [Candidatus Pantoea carbekii]|uniref:DNA polymerase III subunit psi n=1 Tax=Candidatus Pantoea carbekii TaxID=1235990 RepID=U3U9H8_9GAMM|nr:DNA polymerase III subunit psi [Candidatus Pantoea carbekii]AKC31968.1 DNA polymerase III psi subunit HolD [Candidatus Pantoea carbekii]BAO00488.1 hypothetical protein HHS_05180 [Candidatus Pantoea carbekii]
MNSRRYWIIQQTGITQYQLRFPCLLKNNNTIYLIPSAQLILVTEHILILEEPLVKDVLQALNFQNKDVIVLLPNQLVMLPVKVNCCAWLLGFESDHCFNGIKFTTASFNVFSNSSKQKRDLWKQICNYLNNNLK